MISSVVARDLVLRYGTQEGFIVRKRTREEIEQLQREEQEAEEQGNQSPNQQEDEGRRVFLIDSDVYLKELDVSFIQEETPKEVINEDQEEEGDQEEKEDQEEKDQEEEDQEETDQDS